MQMASVVQFAAASTFLSYPKDKRNIIKSADRVKNKTGNILQFFAFPERIVYRKHFDDFWQTRKKNGKETELTRLTNYGGRLLR